MRVNKLTRMNTFEKLFCISAYVSCRYLITDDFSFGIDNKSSSFCKTVRLNQDSKTSCILMSRISKHRMVDFFDSLRSIVTCLMHEIRNFFVDH